MAKYIERLKNKIKIKKFDSKQPIGAWIFVLILFLELTFNFFKLSGLMGIQRGLIYSKNDTFFLSPNTDGIIFDEKGR